MKTETSVVFFEIQWSYLIHYTFNFLQLTVQFFRYSVIYDQELPFYYSSLKGKFMQGSKNNLPHCRCLFLFLIFYHLLLISTFPWQYTLSYHIFWFSCKWDMVFQNHGPPISKQLNWNFINVTIFIYIYLLYVSIM